MLEMLLLPQIINKWTYVIRVENRGASPIILDLTHKGAKNNMIKTVATVSTVLFFLIHGANGYAGMQTITFDIEGMG